MLACLGMIKKYFYLFENNLFFILCLMSIFATAENRSSKIQIPIETYKLSNGLRILLNPDDKIHTASYILGMAVGSRQERPGITGISHMFEHLMFKGTKKYPHFEELYGDNGIVGINAFTSKDYTAYYATFPPERLELILDVESDRMSHLTFSQEELDKERGAVQEERLMRVDNRPTGLLFENLFDLVFTKHPYRQPIIGYSKDISAYTLEKLRNWYGAYYSPNNAVLVISGNFSVKKAKRLIEKYFGALPSKKKPKEVKIIEPEPQSARFRIVNKEVQAPTVTMAYLGPPFGSQEFYALEFISHILGSGESSLLYKKMVRENKLLSSIYSEVFDLRDYSVFYIVYPLLNLSKEEEIKKLILEELKKGIEQGLNDKSLEKVKNIQMNEMVYSLKRSQYRARLILDYEIQLNDYKKMYERLDLMNSMSLEFIQKTGEKYLKPERLSYLILKSQKAKK